MRRRMWIHSRVHTLESTVGNTSIKAATTTTYNKYIPWYFYATYTLHMCACVCKCVNICVGVCVCVWVCADKTGSGNQSVVCIGFYELFSSYFSVLLLFVVFLCSCCYFCCCFVLLVGRYILCVANDAHRTQDEGLRERDGDAPNIIKG